MCLDLWKNDWKENSENSLRKQSKHLVSQSLFFPFLSHAHKEIMEKMVLWKCT